MNVTRAAAATVGHPFPSVAAIGPLRRRLLPGLAEYSACPVQPSERVLPRGPVVAQGRDGELVHLRLVRRPQRLDVGGRAEPGETRDVLGVHDLHVGQVMPATRPAVLGPGGRDRVQGVPDRAVPERVEVNLEALAVQRGDEPGQFGRVDEVDT